MKIGILTFYYAHNYGAVLQAYALKTYLRELGHDVCMINYKNKYVMKEYPKKLRPRVPKKKYLCPKCWEDILKEVERCRYSKNSWAVQYEKFEKFIKDYLQPETEIDWKTQTNLCDIIIFGSDQIWEKNIVGKNEKVYYGIFETNAKKVSYAASCYNVDEFVNHDMFEQLKSFFLISTREKKLADKISENMPEKKIYTVVDPVFLITEREYLHLIKKQSEKSIVFYFVSEDEKLLKISEYLRNVKGESVIEIHYYKTQEICNEWQVADVGPQEFLEYLYNAKMVFTNSFHGTALSIILKKQFWVLNKNIRIVDVLTKFELNDRNVCSLEDWINKKDSIIDFSKTDEKIQELVKLSKEYINLFLDEEK